jgi:high mobility group protein B1
MSLEERKTWKARAEKDKLRYKVELAMYSGPFTMPNFDNNGPKKDPSAPKRPMSAFLDYSKAFRGQVISENPHVTDNKEISKILGMMWNKASHEVKQPFIIKELALRAKYNEDIAQWRKERDDRIAAERSQRESIVHHAIETRTSDQIIRDAEDSRHLLQSRNATNSYEYTASIAFYPSCKTYYHGSEENSSTKFHQQPFDNEVGQPHYHAPCVLDDMHTNSNEGIRFSAKFEQLTDTFHQPYLEIGRCSAYDVYASSCFQERTQYNHISYICKERYGCSENGVGHLDCNSPFASNLPPLTSQLEPYPIECNTGH